MNIQNLNRDKVKAKIERIINENCLTITLRQFGIEFMNWYQSLPEKSVLTCEFEETDDELTEYDTDCAADMVNFFYFYVVDYRGSVETANAKIEADEAFRIEQKNKAYASAGLAR